MIAADLRNRAVYVATMNLGYGEEDANNSGRLIDAMGGQPGGEWCALFVGHCWRRAYELEHLVARGRWTMRGTRPEVGAKALVKAAWAAGFRQFTDPLEALPGDLVCWHRRTGPISWKGHVGIVERVGADGLVHTIEGNVGAFPAKVRRLTHDVRRERFYGFAGLRG